MILVSVVGDFYSSVLPVFYEYKDKITKHIIIHDDFKNDLVYARKIINGTTNFINKNILNIKTFSVKIDEDSLFAIEKLIEIIQDYTQENDELLINITDGLANIAVVLSSHFLPNGAKILTYDRYDNEYNILTQTSMKTYKMQTSIPIRDHFILKDIEITAIEGSSIADKYKKDLNILFEKYEADRLLYINSNEENSAFKKIPTGFLYEQYIFNLIRDLNYDDILLGVKIKDKRLEDIYVENEYDILIMKNNHLHMIECKYFKVLDTTALLYKLDSVRESLDEDANIFIISNFDNYNDMQDIPNAKITQTYKRAFTKKVFLRGSPKNDTKLFLEEINSNFSLNSMNIDDLVKMKESYPSIKERRRKEMKSEIQEFLAKTLNLKTDFFDKNQLLLLMQYKTYKQTTKQTIEAMKNEKFKEFIKLINKMITSKQEYISIYDVHSYYLEHIRTK